MMYIQMEDKTEYKHIWRISRVLGKPGLMRIEGRKGFGNYQFIPRDEIAVIIQDEV